jgi:hypothetical protein
MVRVGADSLFAVAPFGSAGADSCNRCSDGRGVVGWCADVGVAVLIAGSCGPCSGMDMFDGAR